MTTIRNRWFGGALALIGVGLTFNPAPSAAQQRILIPEGTVLTVRTESALSSTTARVGQGVATRLVEPVRVDGYTVLPQGTTLQAQVTQAEPATSRSSGIIGVLFNRMTLPNGRSVAIQGKLTSTDPTEREQIDQAGGSVVFVGGRRGVGAAVAGLGDSNDPVSGVLGALGSIFSSGADVNVPAGTTVAVQLERPLTVTVSGSATGTATYDPYALYTSTQVIRAAQQALRSRDYFRGSVNGQLDDATQRALFQFQIDNRIQATGNLDGRTVQALGLSTSVLGGVGGMLTAADAQLLRRNAQSLVGQWRTYLGIGGNGRLDARRDYNAADLEAYFALSGFADNASLYEQMVRQSGNDDGMAAVGEALAMTARRVDEALRAASAPSRFLTTWQQMRDDLTPFESGTGTQYYR